MYSIDRIESEFAVLEAEGTAINIPLTDLPEGIQEGDLLRQTADGWVLCREETVSRRNTLAERRRKLLGGKP